MAHTNSLQEALVKKLENFRDGVPVFAVQERKVPDLERQAMQVAAQFCSLYSNEAPKFHYRRGNRSTVIQLPEHAQLAVFHESGAMVVRRIMPQFEKMIGTKVDRQSLIERSHSALKKLGLERWVGEDRLTFERLFQIKANGAIHKGKSAEGVLTRAVGAFRRYIGDLPVYGRASVFVKLAAEGVVEAAGMDLRVRRQTPVDYAKIIAPESAADQVVAELSAATPGAKVGLEHYHPEMFALGYFSLPKRRSQAFFQPVYVAMLRSVGWTTLNRLIVIPASFNKYESLSRVVASPPRTELKSQPKPCPV